MQALHFLLFKCYDKYTPKAFMLKGCTCLIIFIQPELLYSVVIDVTLQILQRLT